jgi:hypothetical protein
MDILGGNSHAYLHCTPTIPKWQKLCEGKSKSKDGLSSKGKSKGKAKGKSLSFFTPKGIGKDKTKPTFRRANKNPQKANRS